MRDTRKTVTFFLLLILMPGWLPQVRADDGKAGIYPRLQAAAVMVVADGRLVGGGYFATSYGLAVTAAHLIKGAGQIEALSSSGARQRSKVVARDLGHDLALLRVERHGGLFPSLGFADHAANVGEPLSLYGSALYRHGLLIPGTVAATTTQYEWNAENQCYSEIFAVAAMTPEGLSGGPWVDAEGRVAGLQSGMMTRSNALMGVAFVAPLAAMKALLETGQDMVASSLGGRFAESWEWQPADRRGREETTEGVYILDVLAGGALAAVGAQSGDLITSVNGQAVRYRDQLLALIRHLAPGDAVGLALVDASGARRVLQTTLGACGRS